MQKNDLATLAVVLVATFAICCRLPAVLLIGLGMGVETGVVPPKGDLPLEQRSLQGHARQDVRDAGHRVLSGPLSL